MTDEEQARITRRLAKVAADKDDGVYAKAYAEDVMLLLNEVGLLRREVEESKAALEKVFGNERTPWHD